MIVRVFLYHLDPDALALPALVRGALGDADEERQGDRVILLRTSTPDPTAALDRTMSQLERFAPHWRDLVDVRRVA